MSTAHNIDLREIISLMPGNVYWTDHRGIYQGCNLNVAKTLRLSSPKNIAGKTIHELILDKKIANDVAKLDAQVIKDGQLLEIEQEGFDENGNKAIYLTKKIPLHSAEGSIIGLLGISINITARINMEKELLRAKEEAEAANRVKSEFLANMSHDVKTPLSGVISVAELLAQRFRGEDKKLIQDLQRCGQRLMRFFENCIELSKMDMAELQSIEKAFSLSQTAEAIQELFTPSAIAKKLQFTVFIDPKLPVVLIGNQVNIYRVILNLVGNAIKFTPSGSVGLSVKVDRFIDDKNVIVKLIVQDTGPGIPKDKHKIIFEKMQRLAPSYSNKAEGHGIGLYIVEQYVKAMQGNIDVVSHIGQGSTFTVTLPLMVGKADEKNLVAPPKLTAQEGPFATVANATKRKKKNASKISDTGPRVLLVEDNPVIQNVTQQLIQSLGTKVDVASSAEEAVQLFSSRKYALVYMDVGLPDMDGYQASQALRQIEKSTGAELTPIIALTAHAAADVSTFCADSGMQGALSKPLSLLQAKQALQDYVSLPQSTHTDSLTSLEEAPPPSAAGSKVLPAIDFAASVKAVDNPKRAKEILVMIAKVLDTTFIPEISSAYQQSSKEALEKALHKFLGSLCYASAPALKQAALNLKTAAKKNLSSSELLFQDFVTEARRFQKAVKHL